MRIVCSQDVYDLILRNPGIDTPAVCLKFFNADIVPPELDVTSEKPLVESELASWLLEWHQDAWDMTCLSVDYLIEAGNIVFTDDGSLYPVGYQGATI